MTAPPFKDITRGADPYADADTVEKLLNQGRTVIRLPFFINATDLLAGTSQQLISPIKGRVRKLVVVGTSVEQYQ